MVDRPPTIVVCSCEDTIKLDVGALRRGCRGATLETARQLCGAELDRFRAAAAADAPLIVGCTQEAPRLQRAASSERASLLLTCAKRPAGRGRPPMPVQRWLRYLQPQPSQRPRLPM